MKEILMLPPKGHHMNTEQYNRYRTSNPKLFGKITDDINLNPYRGQYSQPFNITRTYFAGNYNFAQPHRVEFSPNFDAIINSELLTYRRLLCCSFIK